MKLTLGKILIALILGAAGMAALVLYVIKDLPDVAVFDSRKIAESSKIYDRTGEILLYEIYGEEKRTIIPFERIPERVRQATIAIEDVDFYRHTAFDWRSIIRAALTNLRQGRIVQGGSTITQQLAKNAFLSTERTITRKLKELALAFKLEDRYTKDQILGLYLNQIPYGANSYGVQAAARTYFGKNIADASLAEIATLASIPKAPSYYSPWGQHQDELLRRKNSTLEKMKNARMINDEEFAQAEKEEVKFLPRTEQIIAPHFVMEVMEYLNKEYGEEIVRTAGWKIVTTLDGRLQQIAERVVQEGAKRNEELYGGKNAALVAEDATTGQILALVGSRDYFDETVDGNFNVATQGLRQPGSALKPFAYITAFKKGFTPDTIVFDLQTEFETSDDPEKSYKPENFDGVFRGPVRMSEALAQSLNIPAIKTLYLAGLDAMLETTKAFGITTLTERSRYGLSLVLGGGEVKLIELVGAYSVLSQEGVRHKTQLLLKIEGQRTGKIIESYEDRATRAIDSQYARLINNILSDRDLRKSLFQNSFSLTVFPDQEVALKTGTTNDYRDAWALGYTPSLVVGVWAGNNDNTAMEKRGTSILAAVPIWSAFMNEILRDAPLETFNQPDPIIVEKPALRGEVVINDQVHDILYYVDKKSPLGPPPKDPESDGQFKNWEEPVMEWLTTHPIDALRAEFKGTASGELRIQIKNPTQGAFIRDKLIVEAEITGAKEWKGLEVRANDIILDDAPFTHLTKTEAGFIYHNEFNIAKLDLQSKITIKIIDAQQKITEQSVIVFK